METIFNIQDDIVERVSGAISAQIDHVLLAVARKKPLTSLAAYDCWLRGMDQLRNGTLEADQNARKIFEQALAIDSHYSWAYAGLSLSFFNEWSCQLWEHWDDNIQIATCQVFLGKAEEGESNFLKALRLNPYRNLWYYTGGSFVYFAQRKLQTCIDLGRSEKLTMELEQLIDHITKVMGLGNRTRRLNAPAERARAAVTWRIRSAIKKIDAVHPALGHHLTNSIRTGTFCSYNPEKEPDWVLGPAQK